MFFWQCEGYVLELVLYGIMDEFLVRALLVLDLLLCIMWDVLFWVVWF